MNTYTLTLCLALGFSLASLSPSLYAEGDHKHKHADSSHQASNDEKTDHMNHADAHWASPKEASERINPIKSDKDSINRGANIYETSCVACHGEKAIGDGVLAISLEVKPTNLKAMSGGHEDGDFAWKIANGRGAMPAWSGILSENDIWDIVNFIQNLKNETDGSENEHDHSKHKH